MPVVELHAHSYFSFLDALASPEELVRRAGELGYSALALTDHGGLFGVPRFLKAAANSGVKPIVGCEVYVSPTHRTDRSPDLRPVGHHLTLLAESAQGYRNLVKLSSAGYVEGFFHRPRIDLDLLGGCSEGLILLTGCIHSALCDKLQSREPSAAESLLDFYLESFGRDRVFLEIQRHGLDSEEFLAGELSRLSKKKRVPLLATNDVHYLHPEDAPAHQMAMDMRSKKLPTDPRRTRFQKSAYHLLDADEWRHAFESMPDSLAAASAVAARCRLAESDIQIQASAEKEKEAARRLCDLARASADRRCHPISPDHRDRLEHELAAIAHAGLSEYVLLVHDLVSESRRQGIRIGPGRGSAAGSLVAFLLDITEVDPLKYGLSFERFISPARKTPPDIDIDVDYRQRDRMVGILRDLDPTARTYRVGSASAIGLPTALREVSRQKGISYRDVDEKVRSLPEGADRLDSEDRAPWAGLAPAVNLLSKLLRGSIVHPAGMAVVHPPSDEFLPVYASPDGQMHLQYDGRDLEMLGIQKLDILPLKVLAVLSETIRWLNLTGAGSFDLSEIPTDDADTYKMISTGGTLGVFQLESPGMRELLKNIAPDSVETLAAALALYRPGPLAAGVPSSYCDRRHGRARPIPPHPLFGEQLKSTYGLLLYQEQILSCAQRAGLTAAQAEGFRIGLSKGQPGPEFESAIRASGLSDKEASSVLKTFSAFSAFAFNRSHAIAYAILVYRAAYLKCHYPSAFLSNLANETADDRRRLGEIFSEVRRRDLSVVVPDINTISAACMAQPESGTVRVGLNLIRHVSDESIAEILKRRPFVDLADLLIKVPDLAKQRGAEMLAKSGALDAFGGIRREILDALPGWIDKVKRGTAAGGFQSDLFEESAAPAEGASGDASAVPSDLFLEYEALGCFATASPLDDLKDVVGEFCSARLTDLARHIPSGHSTEIPGSQNSVTVAGILMSLRPHVDRSGRDMAFAKIADDDAELEIIFFSDAWQRSRSAVSVGAPILVRGRLEKKGASVTLIADQAVGMDQSDRLYESILLKLDRGTGMDVMRDVMQILKDHPGDRPVYVEMSEDDGVFEFRAGRSCRPTPELRRRLEGRLGSQTVYFLKSKASLIPV